MSQAATECFFGVCALIDGTGSALGNFLAKKAAQASCYFLSINLTILTDGMRNRPSPVRLVTVSTIPRAVPNNMAAPLYTSIFSVPLFPSSSIVS